MGGCIYTDGSKRNSFCFKLLFRKGGWSDCLALNRPTCRSSHPIPTYQSSPSQLATFFVHSPFSALVATADERPVLHIETTRLKGDRFEMEGKERLMALIFHCFWLHSSTFQPAFTQRGAFVWSLETGKRQIILQYNWSPRLAREHNILNEGILK